MEIRSVITKSDLKRFIKLPYKLYKNDPVWVPPLRSEQSGQFNPKKNPTLDHCEFSLFLLLDNNEVIGRIAAFIDRLALETWKEEVGLFGYYECIENIEAAEMLMESAATWLRNKGMKIMRGPWSFVSQEWGLVIEGLDRKSVV
jgi:hypothetical protein